MSRFLDDLAARAAERERPGLTRHLVPRRPAAGRRAAGDRALDLAGNDYLGLLAAARTSSPAAVAAAQA